MPDGTRQRRAVRAGFRRAAAWGLVIPALALAPAWAADGAVDFEVVSIDPRSWVVTARDVSSGEQFRFKVPHRVFEGQRFTAEPTGGGESISVRGMPDARLDKLVLETPLGAPGLGRRNELRGVPGRQRPPQRPPAFEPPRRPDLRAGAGGPRAYQVVSVDPRQWIVTARAEDGSTLKLRIDPDSFAGFRFRADIARLRKGQGFSLFAPNEKPLENCCTLLSPLGR